MTVPTAERLSYSHSTKLPTWKKYTYMFVDRTNPLMKDFKRVKRIEDISGLNLSVITYRANGWAAEFLIPKVKNVFYARDLLTTFEMLHRKRGDILFDSEVGGRDNIKLLKLQDSVVMLPQKMFEQHHKIMINNRSPYLPLLSKIEKVIVEMHNDGTMTNIMKRYGQTYP